MVGWLISILLIGPLTTDGCVWNIWLFCNVSVVLQKITKKLWLIRFDCFGALWAPFQIDIKHLKSRAMTEVNPNLRFDSSVCLQRLQPILTCQGKLFSNQKCARQAPQLHLRFSESISWEIVFSRCKPTSMTGGAWSCALNIILNCLLIHILPICETHTVAPMVQAKVPPHMNAGNEFSKQTTTLKRVLWYISLQACVNQDG